MSNSELSKRLSVQLFNPSLAKDQLAFIEAAITGTEYAKDGFQTLQAWEVSLKINDEGERYHLLFVPETGKVNARWTLYVDKATGQVTAGVTATTAPEPDLDGDLSE